MANDYGSIGLNAQLLDNNSPSANPRTTISNYDMSTDYDRSSVTGYHVRDASIDNAKIGTAAIGTANIGTLSFNEISGGTANLGGTLSGDGVLSVKDEGDTERVLLNKDGIKVTGGSIIVEDDGGGTIIDSTGLVSTQNFTFGGTSDLTSRITASNTYVAVTGGSLDIVLSRAANVLLTAVVQARIYAGTRITTPVASDVQMRIDGTNVGGPTMNMLDDQRANTYFGVYTSAVYTMSRQLIKEIPAGTIPYHLVMKTDSGAGGGTLQLFGSEITYLVLGK